MTIPKSLIADLEEAIATKDVAHRAETLRRLTDLFVTGSVKYTGEQVALFDDVMSRLLDEVDASARAVFGHRMSIVSNAPPNVMRQLALDDAIEVAGPVLTHSKHVDDDTLVESAKTKSQDHLLAISRRKDLPEKVTDVLVDRGNQNVALSTAQNHGASFSEFGFSTLIKRSKDDHLLARSIWSRPDIPREHLLKLFAEASEAVRMTLEATDRRKARMIRQMVSQASNEIQTKAREESSTYAAALSHVQSLSKSGQLNETCVSEFARSHKFDETTIAMSMLCELPIGPIERAFVQGWSEQLLVLAKAIGFSWQTTKDLLMLRGNASEMLETDLEQHYESFVRLQIDTAKKALQFYRLREQTAMPVSY